VARFARPMNNGCMLVTSNTYPDRITKDGRLLFVSKRDDGIHRLYVFNAPISCYSNDAGESIYYTIPPDDTSGKRQYGYVKDFPCIAALNSETAALCGE